ncbi:MAG: ABC transporter substrate-binding protein [Candidatus Woesearchaeota archaeon]
MRKHALIWLAILIILLIGCEHDQKQLQQVTLKLKWINHAQFAGNYVAEEKGFYAEEGLKVKFEPFTFEEPTIEAVANKKADFGITGADELVVARSKGLRLKAFAVIYKINPVCAYSLKESGITKPEDFMGRTVGLERGTNVELLYRVMLKKLGINRSKIREITIGYDAKELLNGTTDISTGYIINEPRLAEAEGKNVSIIMMADYGANIYADVLFTRDDMIENNPKIVQGFLRATLKGWQYAIENNKEAAAITLKYAPGRNLEYELETLRISIPLINTGDSYLGTMKKSNWDYIYRILREENLTGEINVSSVYAMEFLNYEYNENRT